VSISRFRSPPDSTRTGLSTSLPMKSIAPSRLRSCCSVRNRVGLPEVLVGRGVLVLEDLVLRERSLAHPPAPLGDAAERLQLAEQHLQEGGLSGAVRTGDAEHFAARQLEVEILEEDALPVARREVLDLEDLRAGLSPADRLRSMTRARSSGRSRRSRRSSRFSRPAAWRAR